MRLRRDVRLDGVRQGVDAGEGGDLGGLRDGHFRIEDGDVERGLAVAAGHLEVRLLVGDQGDTTGPRCRCRTVVGTPIDGSIGFVGLAEALVVGHRRRRW